MILGYFIAPMVISIIMIMVVIFARYAHLVQIIANCESQ